MVSSAKLMIIPGNGCDDISDANWYQWLAKRLSSDNPGPGTNLKIICETMPDPYKARAKYWIPFIKSKLQDAEKVYVVGHSSGAVAIMRLCEEIEVEIEAAFVVSACATHLDDAGEMEAGYYPTQPDGTHKPWCFDMIRKKCKKLIFISSKTDPFIPIEEPRLLARELGLKQLEVVGDGSKRVENAAEAIGEDGVFFEFSAGGHFMTPHFEALRGIINAVLS